MLGGFAEGAEGVGFARKADVNSRNVVPGLGVLEGKGLDYGKRARLR